MNHHDDLLQPSLAGTEASATSIYSATTGYVAAFLGGPVGAAVIALTNSWRLKRLAKDWPVVLLAIFITWAMVWWEVRMGGDAWLTQHLGSSGPRMLLRVTGLLFFCGIYALHYKSYRSMAVMGIQAPSGWVPGVVAVIVGISVMAGLVYLVSS